MSGPAGLANGFTDLSDARRRVAGSFFLANGVEAALLSFSSIPGGTQPVTVAATDPAAWGTGKSNLDRSQVVV